MKQLKIVPTEDLVTMNGALCRRWEGTDEAGRKVHVFVVNVAVPTSQADGFEYDSPLFETDEPAKGDRHG